MIFLALCLILIGCTGSLIARYQLGSSYSAKAKAVHLVTTGMYKYVRNPIYIFSGLTLIGLLLLVPISYLNRSIIFLVYIFVQYNRAKIESRLLNKVFGKSYQDYLSKTWI